MRKKIVASLLSVATIASFSSIVLAYVPKAQAVEMKPCNEICYPNDNGQGYDAEALATIGEDLSKNGKNSIYYTQFHNYMTVGINNTTGEHDKRGTIRTSKGNVEFRLIGINHDDRADGNGKAGLTFLTTDSSVIPTHQMKHASIDNPPDFYGGWRDSDLRNDLNKGDIWAIMPPSFKQHVVPVIKQSSTNMGKSMQTNATAEKLTLMSYKELVDDSHWNNDTSLNQEGTQYEFFTGKVVKNYSSNEVLNENNWKVAKTYYHGNYYNWPWERGAYPDSGYSGCALFINIDGDPSGGYYLGRADGVAPAFSF